MGVKFQPPVQSVLLLSCCACTLVLLGFVVHLKNDLHHTKSASTRATSVLAGRSPHKMMEHKLAVSRHKRDIGDPRQHSFTGPVGGAVYIRWGSMECPADNELVYIGSVAGALHASSGGGSEYLCVTHEVEWGKSQVNNNGYSYLYGAEFLGAGPDIIFDHDKVDKLTNHDAACAACRSKERSSQLMIPGRKSCPGGWVMEYHGYLMSAKSGAKSQHNYICVDKAPQVDQGGFKAEAGAQLWPVEAYCGSLPCPNYVQGREVTCVICTK